MPTLQEQLAARERRRKKARARVDAREREREREPMTFWQQHLADLRGEAGEALARQAEQARVTRRTEDMLGVSAPGATVIPETGARFASAAMRAGQLVTSPLSLVGGDAVPDALGAGADELSRMGNLMAEAQADILRRSAIPEAAKETVRQLRGGAGSALTVATLGLTGGAGIILGQAALSANDALAQAKAAGLDSADAITYAVGTGAVEGLVTTLWQRIGLGGLESGFARSALEGSRVFARDLGKRLAYAGLEMTGEQLEELSIAVLQDTLSRYQGVSQPTPQEFAQTLIDTAIQSAIVSGPAASVSAFRRGPPPSFDTEFRARQRALVEAVANKLAPEQPTAAPEPATPEPATPAPELAAPEQAPAPEPAPQPAGTPTLAQPVSLADLMPLGVEEGQVQAVRDEAVEALKARFPGAKVSLVGRGSARVSYGGRGRTLSAVVASPMEAARLMARNPANAWESLGVGPGGVFTGRSGKTYSLKAWMNASEASRARELEGSVQGSIVMDPEPANDPLFPGTDTLVYLSSDAVDVAEVIEHETAHVAFGRQLDTASLQTLATFREELGFGPPRNGLRSGAFQEALLRDVYMPFLRGGLNDVQTQSAHQARSIMQRLRDFFARLLGVSKQGRVVRDDLLAEATRILDRVRTGEFLADPAAARIPSEETLIHARAARRAKRMREETKLRATTERARQQEVREQTNQEKEAEAARTRQAQAELRREKEARGREREDRLAMAEARLGTKEAKAFRKQLARNIASIQSEDAGVPEQEDAAATRAEQQAEDADMRLNTAGKAELILKINRAQEVARSTAELAEGAGQTAIRADARRLLTRLHQLRKLAASTPEFARAKFDAAVAKATEDAADLFNQAQNGGGPDAPVGREDVFAAVRSVLPHSAEETILVPPAVERGRADYLSNVEAAEEGALFLEVIGGPEAMVEYVQEMVTVGRALTPQETFALGQARSRLSARHSSALRRGRGDPTRLGELVETAAELASRNASLQGQGLQTNKALMEEAPEIRLHHIQDRVRRLSRSEEQKVARRTQEQGSKAGDQLREQLRARRWVRYTEALERNGISWDMLAMGADDGAWGLALNTAAMAEIGTADRVAAAVSLLSRSMVLGAVGATRVAFSAAAVAPMEILTQNSMAVSGEIAAALGRPIPGVPSMREALRADVAAARALASIPRAVLTTFARQGSWTLNKIVGDPRGVQLEALEQGRALTDAETVFGVSESIIPRMARTATELAGRLYGAADQVAQVPLMAYLMATVPHTVAARTAARGTSEYDAIVARESNVDTMSQETKDLIAGELKDAGAQRPFNRTTKVGAMVATLEDAARRSEGPFGRAMGGTFFPVLRGAIRGGELGLRYSPAVSYAAILQDLARFSSEPSAANRRRSINQVARSTAMTFVVPALLRAFLDDEELERLAAGEFAGINFARIPLLGTWVALQGRWATALFDGDARAAASALNDAGAMLLRDMMPGRQLVTPLVYRGGKLSEILKASPIVRALLDQFEAEEGEDRLRIFMDSIAPIRDMLRLTEEGPAKTLGIQ